MRVDVGTIPAAPRLPLLRWLLLWPVWQAACAAIAVHAAECCARCLCLSPFLLQPQPPCWHILRAPGAAPRGQVCHAQEERQACWQRPYYPHPQPASCGIAPPLRCLHPPLICKEERHTAIAVWAGCYEGAAVALQPRQWLPRPQVHFCQR